ncbi:MAG TPA: SDR family NAD(P)-dependent oxidoreductase, partial [Acetobacteraceae bacterium]|nr:SDR family NAD(P)-dependent oxidoreductase [Acetobacteraceae bacterium]
MNTLLIFGLGYCGRAVADAATDFNVMATSRSIDAPDRAMAVESGSSVGRVESSQLTRIPFAAAEPAIVAATHVLVTVPPDADGDPVLNRYSDAIAAAPMLRWIGYLSSTVVYGDQGGAWVDEATPPSPSQPRGQRRLEAERAWSRFSSRYAVDLFRLAG